ncbi:MAG: PEGA domain-containing protein [Ignavibacteriales bacterium]|nr:PEGA domain-containing protein [Ignavibacteriales bacterium]
MRTRVLAVVTLFPCILVAQEPRLAPGAGRLTVLSEPPGAEVYLDSVHIGATPVRSVEVREGSHDIRVAFPSLLQWNAHLRTDSVHIREGEEISVEFEFGSVFNVHTMPSGATVYYQDRILGTTPLYHRSSESLRSALRIRKEGYEDLLVEPAASGKIWRLKSPDHSGLPEADLMVESSVERGGTRLATYIAAGSMVVSGVAAAYFKQQADYRFNLYASTRSDRHLNATRRYDSYSGVALVFTEVSFAVLAYLLLSE